MESLSVAVFLLNWAWTVIFQRFEGRTYFFNSNGAFSRISRDDAPT